MRNVLALLLAFVCVSAVLGDDTNKTALTDDQLGEKLAQAVMLARVGLFDEAEVLCQQILRQKPDQPTVKQLLREIDERRHHLAQDPAYELKRQLQQTIVPELAVRAAKPGEVIDFLRQESKKLTADKREINFVWLVPADAKLNPVTLNLRSVPFTDILDYVTQLAGLKYRVDAHAVVIFKPEPEKPVPPATEPNVKPQ